MTGDELQLIADDDDLDEFGDLDVESFPLPPGLTEDEEE